ncbi:MAG: P1 family peptidase [Evtepia sp.]
MQNMIPGFFLGQAQDREAGTGCTVILCPNGAVCGVDVRGGSPGTRDTDALNPICNRAVVHAVLLSGGSAFGLDAAGGVMRCLEEKKIGRDVGVTVVPNVCAAVLFDLKLGRADIRPDAAMGYEATKNAFVNAVFQEGNFGAGTGATIGKLQGVSSAMKGGIGFCTQQEGALQVSAVVAVNCMGDVLEKGQIIAGARSESGFADSEALLLQAYEIQRDVFNGSPSNTVIGCVMTNADLSKAQVNKLASQGQNGIARAVRPAHTTYDGDTIFAMSHGTVKANPDAVGLLAARAVEQAIVRAIWNAESDYGMISAREYTNTRKGDSV